MAVLQTTVCCHNAARGSPGLLLERQNLAMKAAHQELNDLRALANRRLTEVSGSPKGGSPLDQEIDALRRTSGGGGKERAALLADLDGEMQVAAGYLVLAVGGVADCLEIAASRGNLINGPALTYALRPVLEFAGLLDWLLDDAIDADERARRYVVWRFADIRERRMFLWNHTDAEESADFNAALDAEERELISKLDRAQRQSRPTTSNTRGFEPAALLGDDGSSEKMPKRKDLVSRVGAGTSLYAIVSITCHTERFAMLESLEPDGPPTADGMQRTKIAGFAVDTNLAIGLAVAALVRTIERLLTWRGALTGELADRARPVMTRVGLLDERNDTAEC